MTEEELARLQAQQEPTEEQVQLAQMNAQVSPQPLSNLQQMQLKIQNYQNQQQQQIQAVKDYMNQYAAKEKGTDFRPLAAWASGFTGNKGLLDTANQMAPESEDQKQKNMIEFQTRYAKMLGDSANQDQMMKLYQGNQKLDLERMRAARGDQSLQLRENQQGENFVQKLEKRYGDMTPGIYTKLGNLNKLVPGGLYGEGGDIPGVSPGAFLVPDFMMGEEASAIQQNARGLAADLIKLQSGSAVSDKEVDRKMKELGMAPGSKESTFRAGLKRLHQQLTNEMKNKEAAFNKETVGTFKERGGITHEALSEFGPATAPAPTGLSEDKMKRLQELRSKVGK